MTKTIQTADLQIVQTVEAYMKLKTEIARLNREKNRMEEQIIYSVGEGNKIQVGEHVLTVRKSATTTSTSWKEAFELALSKVNDATKAVLNAAVTASQKQATRKASISITHKPAEQ